VMAAPAPLDAVGLAGTSLRREVHVSVARGSGAVRAELIVPAVAEPTVIGAEPARSRKVAVRPLGTLSG
jgi:hypothetical protein